MQTNSFFSLDVQNSRVYLNDISLLFTSLRDDHIIKLFNLAIDNKAIDIYEAALIANLLVIFHDEQEVLNAALTLMLSAHHAYINEFTNDNEEKSSILGSIISGAINSLQLSLKNNNASIDSVLYNEYFTRHAKLMAESGRSHTSSIGRSLLESIKKANPDVIDKIESLPLIDTFPISKLKAFYTFITQAPNPTPTPKP